MFLAIVFTVAILGAGCAKQPTEELEGAKASVVAAMQEGAEKYAKDDLKSLNDSLAMAMEEIQTQEKKTFKNYDKAKEMLASVKSQAEALKVELPERKARMKNDAMAAEAAARTAVDEAKGLLAQAPKGKGTMADIEALKSDVDGLESSLGEVQGLIQSEDYLAASDKANAIQGKASEVSAEISRAMEKVGKKK